jgi:hypothetical protein
LSRRHPDEQVAAIPRAAAELHGTRTPPVGRSEVPADTDLDVRRSSRARSVTYQRPGVLVAGANVWPYVRKAGKRSDSPAYRPATAAPVSAFSGPMREPYASSDSPIRCGAEQVGLLDPMDGRSGRGWVGTRA